MQTEGRVDHGHATERAEVSGACLSVQMGGWVLRKPNKRHPSSPPKFISTKRPRNWATRNKLPPLLVVKLIWGNIVSILNPNIAPQKYSATMMTEYHRPYAVVPVLERQQSERRPELQTFLEKSYFQIYHLFLLS